MNNSKILFVTVGTTSFDKLIDIIDTVPFQSKLYELGFNKIIYQIGTGKRIPLINKLNIEIFRLIDDIDEIYINSDLVIAHCGSGSVLDAFKHKIHAVFICNEDTADNHQQQLYQMLDNKYRTTLDGLYDKLDDLHQTTGNFYHKLISKDTLNQEIYNLFKL